MLALGTTLVGTPMVRPLRRARLAGFFFFFFFLFRATTAACGSSQAWGQIGAEAAGLYHSHSNGGSKPHLQTTPQLTATLQL